MKPFRVLLYLTLSAGPSAAAVDGKSVYDRACAACHHVDGQGVAGAFPPLNDSDYLQADTDRAIGAVVGGLRGEITVNGVRYNATMPPMAYLGDEEVAAALTYVMEAWNGGGSVSAEQVARVRGEVRGTASDGRLSASPGTQRYCQETSSRDSRRWDGESNRHLPADAAWEALQRQAENILQRLRRLPRQAAETWERQAHDVRGSRRRPQGAPEDLDHSAHKRATSWRRSETR